MQRWISTLLVLVLLVPAFAPAALAATVAAAEPAMGPHCMRQSGASTPARPAMQCHGGMAMHMAPAGEPAQTSLRAGDNCCQDHSCCRGTVTSSWARLPKIHILQAAPVIESATAASGKPWISSSPFEIDSARAPPRG